MTAPVKPQNGRQSALPPPELVSLPDGVEGDWWTAYGGKLVDGLIELPRIPLVGCPVVECATCAELRDA